MFSVSPLSLFSFFSFRLVLFISYLSPPLSVCGIFFSLFFSVPFSLSLNLFLFFTLLFLFFLVAPAWQESLLRLNPAESAKRRKGKSRRVSEEKDEEDSREIVEQVKFRSILAEYHTFAISQYSFCLGKRSSLHLLSPFPA